MRTGRLVYVLPDIQQGPRIQDPLPRLQTPASMHLCLRGPAGASPSRLSPPVIGNRSSAQLGYQASRQREACLFENCLLQVGKPRPKEAVSQDRLGVSDRGVTSAPGRETSRGSLPLPLPPFLAGTPGSWSPCCGNGLPWGVGEKLAAGSARPGYSPE